MKANDSAMMNITSMPHITTAAPRTRKPAMNAIEATSSTTGRMIASRCTYRVGSIWYIAMLQAKSSGATSLGQAAMRNVMPTIHRIGTET